VTAQASRPPTGERRAELELCAACAAGEAAAIADFERRYFGEVDQALRNLDRHGDLTDEIKQVLREKLFTGESPGIASYQGSGPLGRWVQVVATREALMWLRANRREAQRRTLAAGIAEARDPDLDILRREYRPAFEQAFTDALAALTSKERNLLHYHLVGRLSIDRIGAIYHVHRVTAFRWLREARAKLVEQTRTLLAQRLQLGHDELESLLRLVQSRASVSVERILRQAAG
jgi:RNA polymerase sigma-70 factor (ECF subfamily)